MGRLKNHKFVFSLILGITTALVFQNCGRLQTLDPKSATSSSVTATASQGASMAPPNPIVTASELTPLTVQLQGGTNSAQYPTGIPAGAVYEASTRTLKWIPQKGQSGTYIVGLGTKSNGASQKLVINVNPFPENQLHAGPPAIYRDDQVGYVFVHGAGEVDRCSDQADLNAYWGASPGIIAPNSQYRTTICYDPRKEFKEIAPFVAQQINNANCGPYNRCIIVTHSMGGLLLNFMMTHTRSSTAMDQDPQLFNGRALYSQVKNKTLFVINIASAAGGSKVADLAEDPSKFNIDRLTLQMLQPIIGYGPTGYTRSLRVERATSTLAPLNEDPGVPFFMIPGFSDVVIKGGGTTWAYNLINYFANNDYKLKIFNGDVELAALDLIVLFKSRSDGLVDFRSSCGIANNNPDDGPGTGAILSRHLEYCQKSVKKPNHYVWFASNMNHFIITTPWNRCNNSSSPCRHYFNSPSSQTLLETTNYTGWSAVQVIRERLTKDNYLSSTVPQVINLDMEVFPVATSYQ